MRFWLGRCVALSIAALGLSVSTAQPAPDFDWRAAARQDVLAAYQSYVANHPGTHDPANPGFAARLARARDVALAEAERTSDRPGYIRTLGVFSAEIEDGHALAFAAPLSGTTPPAEWPGFVAAWRGEAMVVHHAGPSSPAAAGTAIVSCDGVPMRDFVLRTMRMRGLRPREAGLWWFRAPQIFMSTASYARDRPSRCTFRVAGGDRDVTLAWTHAPANFDALRAAATDGERTPIGLSEPRPRIFLIGMPDFNPDSEGVAAYNRLYEALRAQRGNLRAARAIVLDLRHNNGGSSAWSRDLARILWGETQVDRAMNAYFANVSIWWRASPDNIAAMTDMERQIRQTGRTALADATRRNADGMRLALTQNEPFYVQPATRSDVNSRSLPATDFTAPVYVITPGRCASACLDAVDVFTRFPNTQLIGAPTSGDSTYMEARTANLPSGQGRLVIPHKLWSGRPRGSGEIYTPSIVMTGLDWSTNAFLNRIEQYLGASR